MEDRLKAVREGGALLMAASYDGDNNRIFQLSRKEVTVTAEKPDTADMPEFPEIEESGNKESAGYTRRVGESPQNNEDTASRNGTKAEPTDKSRDKKETGKSDTERPTSDVLTYTYYEKVYDDPQDTIFWYGFGQGLAHFLGGTNQALSAELSDMLSDQWDAVTGRYTLVLHSEAVSGTAYSANDIKAMKEAGLTDEDIEAVTGQAPIIIPSETGKNTRVDYELTYYLNDISQENTQVLMEYGKRGELKNVYTYGLDRLSKEHLVPRPTEADTGNDNYRTDYYLYDGRGSVTQTVSKTEDILSQYSYDPFGNLTTGLPGFDSFYGYNAEETNPTTGLQYLRARYYDANMGRFTVKDDYLGDIYEPLTLNRYAYTGNNPVNYNDPSGYFPVAVAIAVGIAALGIGTVAAVNHNSKKPIEGVMGAAVGSGAGLMGGAATEKNKPPIKAPEKSPIEKVLEVADEILKNIDEVNRIEEEIKKAIANRPPTLDELLERLQAERAELCETLQEQKEYVDEYNSGARAKVELPEFPDLEGSPNIQLNLFDNLTDDEILFVKTIYGEAASSSETSWQAIANVIMNRVGVREWKKYTTPIEVIKNTGFDAYTYPNVPYKEAESYFENRDYTNAKIEQMIRIVIPIYRKEEKDITDGSVLYYSPAAQAALHEKNLNIYKETPPWNFSQLEEVIINGLENDDFKFYKYRR